MSTKSAAVLPAPGRKRAQILKELRRQIALQGVHGLTTRGLATASGVATRTLFNLFGSKDALICESLKDMDHDVHVIVLARSKACADPLDQLIDYIEVATELIRSEPGYSNAIIYAYYSSDASLLEFRRYIRDFKQTMFAEVLGKMQRSRELQSWVPIDLLAGRIFEAHIGVVAEWTRGLTADDELAESAVYAVLTLMVGHVGRAYERRVISRLTALSESLEDKKRRAATPADATGGAPAGAKGRATGGDPISRAIKKMS